MQKITGKFSLLFYNKNLANWIMIIARAK